LKRVNIGICGLGTVGSGTFNVLKRNVDEINARANSQIEITHIGARRENPLCDTAGIKVSRDIFDVANDPDVDILVELIGGTSVALDLISQALRNGKHVVTANKALIAEHGNTLFELAREHKATLSFEAAVAGGIPIISALREGLAANKVEWLAGIINGTGNFILTEMRDKGREFADVLAQAQELGYAEADPTFDVEGIDAAHKLVILAAIAFGAPLQFDKVFTEGISNVLPEDLTYAQDLGYQIKHLGIARRRDSGGIELRVHPTLVPSAQLIANVDGVMNAVLVKGDAVGSTLYYGPGAGSEATASAVIADIVRVSRSIGVASDNHIPHLGSIDSKLQEPYVLPITEVETAYYLRMSVLDRPGVLSTVTQILSDAGISIEALVQKEPNEGEPHVPVILLTSRAIEKRLVGAIEEIEKLDTISDKIVRIRVEHLN